MTRSLEMSVVEARADLGVITPAELAALRAYLDCGSVKGAAHDLGVAESTVKNHMQNVRSKLNARTTAEAVLILADKLAARPTY